MIGQPRSVPWRWSVPPVVVPLAILVGAMALLPIDDIRALHGPRLGFSQAGPPEAVLHLLAVQLLLLAAVLAWLTGIGRRAGVLAVLAAAAWFGPDISGVDDAPGALRALGRFVAAPFLPVLLLHLGLVALDRDRAPRFRALLVGTYAVTGDIAIAGLVTYDPFGDATCTCDWTNPFLLWWRPGIIRTVQVVGAVWAVGLALVTATAALGWLEGTRVSSPGRAVSALGLVLLALALALRGFTLVAIRSEDPSLPRWWTAWLVMTVAVMALAAGVITLSVERWLRLTRMRRLAATLETAPEPGTLQGALRHTLDDPALQIAYRLDDGRLVDAAGATADPPGPGMQETPVERSGEVVAMLRHRGTDLDTLAGVLSPTLVVALDNERLRAARLAQLQELRASRARIVMVGDAERRRLERDLHDGVQQQLLSLLFDIRLARLGAERAGDVARVAALAEGEGRAQQAVDALRRIAHGIHPAVLSRSGLPAALVSLAEDAPIPLEVAAEGVGRLPDLVETAAYQVVAQLVDRAAANAVTALTVTVAIVDGVLCLEVVHDGSDRDDLPIRLVDRVGAAGGSMAQKPLPAGGTLLRVELPCG